MRFVLWGLIILAVAGAGGAYYYVQAGGAAPGARFDIDTAEVDVGEIRQEVFASGAVSALVTVEVGSQLSGQVSELLVDFNSEVKTGDLMARIDPRTFETRVKEAEAQLAIARSNVEVQTANLKSAKARLTKAKLDFERARSLRNRGAGSEATFDAAVAELEAAEANVSIAEAQILSAETTVQQREAALENANIDLERTYIRAPIDGTVVDRQVDLGQTVAASLSAPTLFTIAGDLGRVQIEALIDEADIGKVAEGNAVTFRVDAYRDQEFRGSVTQRRLQGVREANVVTYTVVISANNPRRLLLPGMTAELDITTGEKEDVLRVATEALRFEPRGPAESLIVGDRPSETQGRRGGGGGGGGGFSPERFFDRIAERTAEQAGLTPEETEALKTALREEFKDGFPEDRSQIRGRIDRVLKTVLTEDQYARVQAANEGRGTQQRARPVTVWVLREDGKIEARRVVPGLADDRRTEILRGDVKAGDKLVTRIREVRE